MGLSKLTVVSRDVVADVQALEVSDKLVKLDCEDPIVGPAVLVDDGPVEQTDPVPEVLVVLAEPADVLSVAPGVP